MLTSFEKKVEVFLFYHLKRRLNGISDRAVRRCFTGKSGENRDKKENELTDRSVSKEGRGYRRGEPSDIATLRWFPSPKDLHVLNPKRP